MFSPEALLSFWFSSITGRVGLKWPGVTKTTRNHHFQAVQQSEISVFSTRTERKQNFMLIKVYSSNFIQLGDTMRFLKINFHTGYATPFYVSGFSL